MDELIDEVRLAFHALSRAAADLHAGEPVTVPMRAVLEHLDPDPCTVPEVARSRGVTRQHIQTQVNALLALELVELIDNPAHRRSSLVRLTPGGAEAIRRMRERERPVLEQAAARIGERQIDVAVDALRALRTVLAEV